MDNYRINLEAVLGQIKNEAQIYMVGALIPDLKERKLIMDILGIFSRHGVEPEVAMSIITESADVLKDNNK